MNDSHRFFANKACRYYPCHEMEGELNCLFCYCPLYFLENCGGDCSFTKKGIKDCSACLLIHDEKSWEFIQRRLLEENRRITEAWDAAHPQEAAKEKENKKG